ncbi:MAG: hypothetical protein ABR611_08760 [Chthoniobacterales bacterium]
MRNQPHKGLSFGENHLRTIMISLRFLDKNLCEWERWARGEVPGGAMYQPRDTLSADQKKKLLTEIAEARRLIARVRDDLKLVPETAASSRLIVGQATILWEMLAELNSRSLGAYGAVSQEIADYIDPVGDQLTEAMKRVSALLSRPTA